MTQYLGLYMRDVSLNGFQIRGVPNHKTYQNKLPIICLTSYVTSTILAEILPCFEVGKI